MILRFTGKYRFLSNFWPIKIQFEGVEFPSVEHAYVAAKTLDIEERKRIASVGKPGDAKRYGRKLKLRQDWGSVRIEVMERLIEQKFADPELKEWLLATGEQQLIEGNTWGDHFWGVCGGVGENHLGKILMRVRAAWADPDNPPLSREELGRMRRVTKS